MGQDGCAALVSDTQNTTGTLLLPKKAKVGRIIIS